MFGLFTKKVDINHDLVDKTAGLLRLQVMLCRFQPKFIAALEEDVVRGYFMGFFDCCLQRRGVAILDDETFARLVVQGHEKLLATYMNDIPGYTFASLRRQDSSDFQRGMQIGGAECLSVLDAGHQPIAFPQYVHEGRGALAD